MTDKQCLAVTNSGERCKREAVENGYCTIPSHQEQAEGVEKQEEEVCGHENVHAQYDHVEHLTCELPPGHSGNHAATVYEKTYGRGGSVRNDGEIVTEWTDLAGVSVDEIEPELVPESTLSPSEQQRQDFIAKMKADLES